MATSSIFETVRMTDPNKIEAFIDAMERAAQVSDPEKVSAERHSLTDIVKIREAMAKRKAKE